MQTRIQEISYIHVLRSVACMMVVFLHCLPPSDYEVLGLDAIFRLGIVFVTSPCVPIFFMITGILILPTSCEIESLNSFYKKRISKVLYPLIFWGIVYSVVPYMLNLQELTDTIKDLILVPFVYPPEIGAVLWYLYILIGIYLIIPFISSKVYNYANYQKIYLIIWLLSSLVFLWQMYEPRVLGINEWEHNVHSLSYFWGYFGFCILGLYINRSIYKMKAMKAIILYILVCLLMFLGNKYGDSNLSQWISSFLSIPSIILTVILFMYIKSLRINENGFIYKLIKKVSHLSFGIYLSHILVYRCVTISIYHYSTSFIFQILVFIITFIFSWFLSYIISKLNFSKFIVGV